VTAGNRYGSGSGRILLDNLRCTGDESSLNECGHRGWGVHNCGHSEDVSIVCGNSTPTCKCREHFASASATFLSQYM